MTLASRASLLIDADSYYRTLLQAFERARRSILVLGWDFDGDVSLDPRAEAEGAAPLRELLPRLLEQRPELEIRILIWRFSVLYAQNRTLPPPIDPRWPSHPRLQFRFAHEHPFAACHHDKLVTIDDALAFVGGIDLTSQRWDVRSHDAGHPLRVDAKGRSYAPKHDVQLAVAGETAHSLAQLARDRWHAATGERPAPVTGSDPWPEELRPRFEGVSVGIARTVPAWRDRPEQREVEQLVLDALDAAREHVYIESQYLTAAAVGEGLAALLQRPGGPAVVAIVRRRADGIVQRFAMGENRNRLLRRLASVDREERLRACYPVVRDESGAEHEIDVHCKLFAIDDRLLKVGSSNLNNRSMGFDTEIDLVLEAQDERARQALRATICELLGEHLDRRPDDVAEALRRDGLLGVIDAADETARRRLVPLPLPEGPSVPLPGTGIVDPGHPFGWGGRSR